MPANTKDFKISSLNFPVFTPSLLFGIVEFGLGGYVVGRSVEKIAPSVAEAIKR